MGNSLPTLGSTVLSSTFYPRERDPFRRSDDRERITPSYLEKNKSPAASKEYAIGDVGFSSTTELRESLEQDGLLILFVFLYSGFLIAHLLVYNFSFNGTWFHGDLYGWTNAFEFVWTTYPVVLMYLICSARGGYYGARGRRTFNWFTLVGCIFNGVLLIAMIPISISSSTCNSSAFMPCGCAFARPIGEPCASFFGTDVRFSWVWLFSFRIVNIVLLVVLYAYTVKALPRISGAYSRAIFAAASIVEWRYVYRDPGTDPTAAVSFNDAAAGGAPSESIFGDQEDLARAFSSAQKRHPPSAAPRRNQLHLASPFADA